MYSRKCLILLACIPAIVIAAPTQVRVLNDTNKTIYIHKGGFARSAKIKPHNYKVFTYPFKVIPPGSTKAITTSILVATAGGRWTTDDTGKTRLTNAQLQVCLDYRSEEYKKATGNRLWHIKHATGVDPSCHVKPYVQAWATS